MNILDKIVADKRLEVDARKSERPTIKVDYDLKFASYSLAEKILSTQEP